MSRRTVVVIAAVLTTALAGCGGSSGGSEDAAKPAAPETFTAKGAMTLIDSGVTEVIEDECAGTDGYDDMISGAQVVVRDGDGTKVAIGALGPGRFGTYRTMCIFDFEVPDVPAGGGVYSVEVSHRGEISFKESDAGNLAMTLS